MKQLKNEIKRLVDAYEEADDTSKLLLVLVILVLALSINL